MAEISANKRIWGWMMFDWATQPFYTLLLTFVFGPYFAEIATNFYTASGLEPGDAKAQAQKTWSGALTLIGLFIAFTAPLLGAMADNSGRRIPWMVIFAIVYLIGTWSLWWMVPDGSRITQTLISFGIAMVVAEYMLVFINAILPSLGTQDEIGELSGNGFALGYAGGVVALFIMLLLLAESGETGKTLIGLSPMLGLDPDLREGTRSVGPFTAIWFAIFMIPFFLWVKDRPNAAPKPNASALSELGKSLKDLPQKPSLFSYLLSSMFYRDALNAIYAFGGVYATLVLEWDIIKLGVFGILAAISSAIFTWVGGQQDRKRGPKPVIVATSWILILVTTVIVGMSRESLFGIPLPAGSGLPDIIMFVLGCVIGGAGGAMQGASRSLMARHADPDRPTEAFGLYAFSGKATAFLAPALIYLVTDMTDSARFGLSPIIVLFIVALVLLRWVNPQGNRGTGWSGS